MVQTTGEVIALAVVMLVLQLIAVGLRLRVRSAKGVERGPDDFLIVAASVFFVLSIAVIFVQCADTGLGDHVPLVDGQPEPPSYLFNLTERLYECLSMLPVGFAKLAILFFYRRIFRGKVFNALNYFLIACVVMWMAGYFFSLLFMCLPLNAFFNNAEDITCVNEVQLYYSLAISDVVMDVLILAMPLPFVWRLQMPWRYKCAVSGIFLLGCLTIAASIARLQTFIVEANLLPQLQEDYTWYTAPTSIWTFVEGALAIVSACLPTLKPLVHGMSLESIARSFRSALSLGSLRSRRSTTQDQEASRAIDISGVEHGASGFQADLDGDSELTRTTKPESIGAAH